VDVGRADEDRDLLCIELKEERTHSFVHADDFEAEAVSRAVAEHELRELAVEELAD
jgi:hypothetical protein